MNIEYQCRPCPCSWLGRVAQVLLPRGQLFGVDASWEQSGGLLLGHAGRDHHTLSGLKRKTRLFYVGAGSVHVCVLDDRRQHATYLPVGRRGHSFPGCELEGVHHSQDLVKVASGGGRVEERQFEPFVGADDKHLNTHRDVESERENSCSLWS